MKELKNIKKNFKDSHAARMEELEKTVESLKKTQAQKPEETKNSAKFKAMADLLASL